MRPPARAISSPFACKRQASFGLFASWAALDTVLFLASCFVRLFERSSRALTVSSLSPVFLRHCRVLDSQSLNRPPPPLLLAWSPPANAQDQAASPGPLIPLPMLRRIARLAASHVRCIELIALFEKTTPLAAPVALRCPPPNPCLSSSPTPSLPPSACL